MTPILPNTVLRVEHGWLTIRTESGWLLWSKQVKDIDNRDGVDLSKIIDEGAKAYADWINDPVRTELESGELNP